MKWQVLPRLICLSMSQKVKLKYEKRFLSTLDPMFFQDVPLFEGIISDLFPGTKWPNPDYGALMDAIVRNCKLQGLQATNWYLKKIIQVRFC